MLWRVSCAKLFQKFEMGHPNRGRGAFMILRKGFQLIARKQGFFAVCKFVRLINRIEAERVPVTVPCPTAAKLESR